MQLRYRLLAPLAAVCLALAFVPAFAEKPAPIIVSPSGPVIDRDIGSVTLAPPACLMGVLGPPSSVWAGLFFPPQDEYFTLLKPQQCPTCPDNFLLLKNAHLQILYTVPCQLLLRVSITPAEDPDGDGCYTPNPFAPEICPAVQYLLGDGGFLNTCLDFSLPLPGGCCINGPVFLEYELDATNCPGGEPDVCAPISCQNCVQYNYYPGAPFPGTDLCVFGAPFGFYGVVMYADADCCTPTPTLPGSWGMLKTLYR